MLQTTVTIVTAVAIIEIYFCPEFKYDFNEN
jgi:hypothetical protein